VGLTITFAIVVLRGLLALYWCADAGASSSRPVRSSAKRQTSYAEASAGHGLDDDGLISSDDGDKQQHKQRAGRGRAAAAAAAAGSPQAESGDSLSVSEAIEDSETEAAGGSTRKRGRRQQTAPQQQRRQQQQQSALHTQATAGGSVLGPNSIDGGYVDSDSDEGGTGAAPAPVVGSVGGRKRRVLPSSLAS
jgi:hypothetical protein